MEQRGTRSGVLGGEAVHPRCTRGLQAGDSDGVVLDRPRSRQAAQTETTRGDEMKGSVVRRGKRWYCIVDSYEGTKRKRKWHSGYATKREAIAALTDIVGAINRGEYVPPSKQLLADYLDTWLKGRATQLRPSTLASYRMNVEVHVVPHIGSIRLERLRAAVTPLTEIPQRCSSKFPTSEPA